MPTATEQAAIAAATGFWVDQSATAADQITTNAAAAAASAWSSYARWYDAALVAQQAADLAALSGNAQEAVTGLFAEYIAQLTSSMTQNPRIRTPKIQTPTIRNGVDPVLVHSRPATVFKETFAFTGDEDLALSRSIERSIQLIETDIMLAARQAQQEAMSEVDETITHYRRVLRPELSKTGSCALCIVASTQIYKLKDLLPIHGRCKCETMPIVGHIDPGQTLNQADLKRLYEAAGSTNGLDLKRVRVQVNEHGELGPVLTVRGQKFTGPDDLDRPAVAKVQREQLVQLEGVLKDLTRRPNDRGQLDDPLAYQRARIANLQRITAA